MQGHFQIILNRQHCPLLQKDLSIPMRIMYASGVWSYVVGAISTPFFIIVPMVGLLARSAPDALCQELEVHIQAAQR